VSKPVFCLSSFEQEGRCHVRIASAVQYRNDNERLFIWCICDQKISHGMKSLWSGSKIRARSKQAVSCVEAIRGDEFPNFVEILESLWGEDKPAHKWRRSSLSRRRRSKTIDRFNTVALAIIIAAIQHVADLS
jgi:hypothetical protein